jgi:hypothetical protein
LERNEQSLQVANEQSPTKPLQPETPQKSDDFDVFFGGELSDEEKELILALKRRQFSNDNLQA